MSVKFIAEVSSNHNKDLNRSKEFIEIAAKIGCDSVKFQLFKIDQLFAPEVLEENEELRKRKNWELPLEFIPVLAECAHKLGIKFSCTPFYLEAVDELKQYVDFYKIASYELLWNNLLKKVAGTNKPVVLSTGMASLEEVKNAVNILRDSGCKELTLLHCVSSYPTPPEEANLNAIETIRKECKCKVGWSDHSVNPGIIYRAIHRWQADMIEFHLDIEGVGAEFKSGHCWLPDDIKKVIDNIKTGIKSDGTREKKPSPSEILDRDWRADPSDGLRPLVKIRREWKKR